MKKVFLLYSFCLFATSVDSYFYCFFFLLFFFFLNKTHAKLIGLKFYTFFHWRFCRFIDSSVFLSQICHIGGIFHDAGFAETHRVGQEQRIEYCTSLLVSKAMMYAQIWHIDSANHPEHNISHSGSSTKFRTKTGLGLRRVKEEHQHVGGKPFKKGTAQELLSI